MAWSISHMRRVANNISLRNNPKYHEGERVKTTDNGIERYAIVKSWVCLSDDTYRYWVKLESNDIDRMRLKKQSELQKI